MLEDHPIAEIIPFSRRRTRPRVCIAIRGCMLENVDVIAMLCIVAANDQQYRQAT